MTVRADGVIGRLLETDTAVGGSTGQRQPSPGAT